MPFHDDRVVKMFHYNKFQHSWVRGAVVARLTPDQKAACSNHVGVNASFFVTVYNKTLSKLNLTLEGSNFSFDTEKSESS